MGRLRMFFHRWCWESTVLGLVFPAFWEAAMNQLFKGCFFFFFSGGISAAILLPGLVVRNPGGAGGCLASPSDLVQKHGAEMMGVRWHPILCARELY